KKRIRRSSPQQASSGQRQSSSPRSTTPADVSRSCWPLWPMAPTRANETPRPRPLLPAEPPGTAHQASGSAAEASAAAPAETPAWQLIRPRPRRRPTVPLSDLPRRSGSDNDSDDGERGRGPEDDAEETSPIRAVRDRVPVFRLYDQLHQRRPASRPTSSLSRRSNQTPIVESADLRSRRRERGSASPAALPRRLPRLPNRLPCRLLRLSPPPPQPSAAAEKTVVPQQRTRKTSRGSATEKPQAAVKSPTPLAVQNGAKSSQNNSVSDASKATTETKEQQAAAATATSVAEGAAVREETQQMVDLDQS
uniref:Serine/arginine repetitive matrix protein 1-like n=1 Tax=Macrostomum lignano TaxID=282301 RepID=A0A1I8FCJ5_9PLAT